MPLKTDARSRIVSISRTDPRARAAGWSDPSSVAVILVTWALSGILVWGMLAALSLPSGWPSQADKIVHVVAFGLLVLPAALHSGSALRLVAVYAIILGTLIELGQPAFARDRDLVDLVANLGGIAAGSIMGTVQRCLWRRVVSGSLLVSCG